MSNEFFAYGADTHAVEAVMRIHSVKRWHMVDTTRIQTLAEHSANVALLAMLIAKTAPIEFFATYTHVAAAALVHDIPEAFTGDIPTHTKQYLGGLDDLEDAVTDPAFHVVVDQNTKALIKICDLADGIRFVRLHGVDLTADHARKGLEQQLERRFADAQIVLQWPVHLLRHVRSNVMFYAYESH